MMSGLPFTRSFIVGEVGKTVSYSPLISSSTFAELRNSIGPILIAI